MTYILGINELYHDISVVLLKDGKILGVVEEERLNRIKHTPGLCWGGKEPRHSLDWCLEKNNLKDEDIEHVAISYDMPPLLSIKTIVDAVLCNYRRMGIRGTINQRIGSGDPAAKVIYGNILGYFTKRKKFLKELRSRFGKVVEIKHHLCHASSAFRLSGFDKANILIIDGLGEDHSTSLFKGTGNYIEGPFRQYSQYQSLGMMYKSVTFMLGFGYFGDGKTMGLSAYGNWDDKYGNILNIKDRDYFIKLENMRKILRHARKYNQGELTQEHKNIAKTIQTSLEKAAVQLATDLHQMTGYRNLCLAGGVALNCNMNAALLDLPFVDDLFVQPGAMDMGTAIGAAMESYAQLGYFMKDRLEKVSYGLDYTNEQIEAEIKKTSFKYENVDDVTELGSQLLAKDEIIGWFQGGMEFGPRALGNRSILANPTKYETRDKVNNIKKRELWRPLAPSILEEDMQFWFKKPYSSPFMTLNLEFKDEVKEKIPAVVHIDGTARVQSVNEKNNLVYYNLIRKFKEKTGIPIILNTSFNEKSEPIVCSPKDALRTFGCVPLKHLLIGNFHVVKE